MTPATLRAIPPRVRFWRNVRRTVLVGVILALLGGGYCVFKYVDWYPHAPTWALLFCAESSLGTPDGVLMARFDAGELTMRQADRFAAALAPFELTIDSPWPASVPPRCELRELGVSANGGTVGPGSPAVRLLAGVGPLEIWVDGALVEGRAVSPLALSSMVPPRITGDLLGQKLSAGTHEVEFVHTWPRSSPTSPLGSRGASVLRFPAKARVVIEDKPPASFVEGVWNEELARCVGERLTARIVSGRGESPVFALKSSGTPVAISAEMWVRPAGRGEYVPANENYPSDTLRLFPGAHVEKLRLVPRDVVADADAIDVRLVPDQATIGQAMLGGQDRYFRGVIEWEGLPVFGADEGVGPTRVSEMAAEDIGYARPLDR